MAFNNCLWNFFVVSAVFLFFLTQTLANVDKENIVYLCHMLKIV